MTLSGAMPRPSLDRVALHSRNGHRVLIGSALVLLIAFLTLTAVLFVWPATNAPQRVNAIVVLGGSGDRVAKGVALARAGYAPMLLISDHDEAPCPKSEDHFQVICFNPDPPNTQVEARYLARVADARHWHRLLVVPSVPQTTRARIRLKRCYKGTLLFDPASPGGIGTWIYSIAYEWGSLLKALVQRGC